MKRIIVVFFISMMTLFLFSCGNYTDSQQTIPQELPSENNTDKSAFNGLSLDDITFAQDNYINACRNDLVYCGVTEDGQQKLLCDDPICVHNNEECVAYFNGAVLSFLFNYKRYVITREEHFTNDNGSTITNKMSSSIYITQENGKDRKKLLSLDTEIINTSHVILKDNILYFWGFDEEEITYSEAPEGIIETQNLYSFSLYSYDIYNNKLNKLLSVNQVAMIPEISFICGDTSIYTIYTTRKGSIDSPQFKQTVVKISDGKCNVIKTDENVYIEYVGAIQDDLIFYYNISYQTTENNKIYSLSQARVREILPIGEANNIQVMGKYIVVTTSIDKNNYQKGNNIVFYDINGNEVNCIQFMGKTLGINAVISNKCFYTIWEYSNKDSTKNIYVADIAHIENFEKMENLVWTRNLSN